jgi:hypothetical protein
VDIDLFNERIRVERKHFSFDLKENPRGRFLKITEDVGGRKDAIIIPATGLSSIIELMERVVSVHDEEAGEGASA